MAMDEAVKDREDVSEGMRPPLTYYGGKQRLCKDICAALRQSPNWGEGTHYVEPFFGGGAVFFAKEPQKLETINDLNDSLVTFYRVVKHPKGFAKVKQLLDGTLYSKSDFQKSVNILKGSTKDKDPVIVAWAVFVNLHMAFGSGWGSGWGYARTGTSEAQKFANVKEQFTDAVCRRLENASIDCSDALSVIRSRDSENALFYCDPPYADTQCKYAGLDFSAGNLSALLRVLKGVKGRFVLSGFPHYMIDMAVKEMGWQLVSKRMAYGMQVVDPDKKDGKTEVLVSNYPFELEGWSVDHAFGG